jgi:hypothetical protein
MIVPLCLLASGREASTQLVDLGPHCAAVPGIKFKIDCKKTKIGKALVNHDLYFILISTNTAMPIKT